MVVVVVVGLPPPPPPPLLLLVLNAECLLMSQRRIAHVYCPWPATLLHPAQAMKTWGVLTFEPLNMKALEELDLSSNSLTVIPSFMQLDGLQVGRLLVRGLLMRALVVLPMLRLLVAVVAGRCLTCTPTSRNHSRIRS